MGRTAAEDFLNPPRRVIHNVGQFFKGEVDESVRHGGSLWNFADLPSWVGHGRVVDDMSHQAFSGIVRGLGCHGYVERTKKRSSVTAEGGILVKTIGGPSR